MSNIKGGAFERKVAKIVAGVFGASPKQIYRTPLSGGHPYADTGDLVIAPELRNRFPFIVECKHRKPWKPGNFFKPTAEEKRWLVQVTKACENSPYEDCHPLLVVTGHHIDIYCAFQKELFFLPEVEMYNGKRKHKLMLYGRFDRVPTMSFHDKTGNWVLLKFSDFLAVVATVPRWK